MNKLLILVCFLSSIAAAPCAAKGDSDVSVNRTEFGRYFSVGPCSDLGMGVLSMGSLHRCYGDMVPHSVKVPKLARQKAIPFLIDLSSLLDKKPMRLEPVYFTPREVPEKPVDNLTVALYLFPVFLAVIALTGVYLGLREWNPNADTDKDLSI